MTTIKQITGELGITSGVNYVGKELNQYKFYYGRVIIKYKKSHQTQCVNMKNILDKLEGQQILSSVYDGEDFPGYDKVRLSFFTVGNNNRKEQARLGFCTRKSKSRLFRAC